MTDVQVLGTNIRRFRLLKGMTQKELASKIELSADYFSKIERAKTTNIGVKYLIRICEQLDIQLYQLFLEDPEELNIKFVVGKENLKSLERVLDKINERVDIRFKQGDDKK